METPAEGLPNQDAGMHALLDDCVQRVHRGCQVLGLTPLDDVVVGTLAKRVLNAANANYFGTTSIITVNAAHAVFVLLLAKCVLPGMARVTEDGGLLIGERPSQSQLDGAALRLKELLSALRDAGDPAEAPTYVLRRDSLFYRPVADFIRCAEVFIIGHEYGHLMVDHNHMPADSFWTREDLDIELRADTFAVLVTLASCDDSVPGMAIIAPIVFMASLALMEEAAIRPRPISHPPSAERLAWLLMVIERQGQGNDAEWIGRFVANLLERMEELWSLALSKD